MKQPMRLPQALALTLALACSSNEPGPGECNGNNDCASGQICDAATCVQLCAADTQCITGEVCVASVCQPGHRDEPDIRSVDGDDTTVCPDANGSHCISTTLVVTGVNLEGALFVMAPADNSSAGTELSVADGSTNERALVLLPDVAPGQYVLSATNQAGSDQQTLSLLQGPPGEAFSPTPNQVLQMVNDASGTIDAARLPVGTGATSVAAGNHGHADLAPLVHTHDNYVEVAGGAMSGDLTVNGEVEGVPGDSFVWAMMHAAAAAACAGAAPVGGSGSSRAVFPRHAPQTCTWTCANEAGVRTNCSTAMAVGSIMRQQATAHGQPVALFYNYGCGDTQNNYDETLGQGLDSSYAQYCCCYK